MALTGQTPSVFCCALSPSSEQKVFISNPPRLSPGRGEETLSRNEVLRVCLALEDEGLVWVWEQLLRLRTLLCESLLSSRKPHSLMIEIPGEALSLGLTLPGPISPAYLKTDRSQISNGTPKSGGFYAEPQDGEDQEDEAASENGDHDDHVKNLRDKIHFRDLSLYGPIPGELAPYVQFEAPMFYCTEAEGAIHVGIIRIGDLGRRSTVRYATVDNSARSGKYTPASGTAIFEPGDHRYVVTIELEDDTCWDPTLEFNVQLYEDGLENGKLSDFMRVARVKVLDDDIFPHNRFRKYAEQQTWQTVNKPRLMWEYFKTNARNAAVRSALWRTILAQQAQNLYFIMGLFLNLYMVDFVLCNRKDIPCKKDQTSAGLTLIVALKFLPFPILHWLEFKEPSWKLGGATRLTLQCNLLRKYLAYNTDVLRDVDESKLFFAITRDASELASDAVCKIPHLVSALTRLAL
ncbi:unnamed protein product, partial [Polarella glacialis]